MYIKEENMNKWQTLNSRVVYKNEFLIVRDDDVIDPNGNKGKRNIIEIGGGSVVVVAKQDNGELYLVGQNRYAVNDYSWEFVSGGMKLAENELKAAQRELAEELNLRARKWKKILSFYPGNSFMSRQAHVFLAEDLESACDEAVCDEYEKIDIRTVSVIDMKKEVSKGDIRDSFTICSFYAFLEHVK